MPYKGEPSSPRQSNQKSGKTTYGQDTGLATLFEEMLSDDQSNKKYTMDNSQIEVTFEDFMDGLRIIEYVDSRELVDKNLKPATLSAGERRTLISISLLAAFSPDYDRESHALKVDYGELYVIHNLLERFEKSYSNGESEDCIILLGGLVSVIKNGRLSELVKVCEEQENSQSN